MDNFEVQGLIMKMPIEWRLANFASGSFALIPALFEAEPRGRQATEIQSTIQHGEILIDEKPRARAFLVLTFSVALEEGEKKGCHED